MSTFLVNPGSPPPINSLQPGDTVLFREGYHGGFLMSNLNGVSGAPITFKNYPGETAILDPYIRGAAVEFTRGWASGNQKCASLIQLNGKCSYLTFDGFKVQNSNPTWNSLLGLNLDNGSDLTAYRSHDMDALLHVNAFIINSNTARGGATAGVLATNPASTWSHHLIFQNMTFNRMMGIWGGDMDYCQFINNYVQECRYDYVFYCTGTGYLLSRNTFSQSAYGMHFNGCSGPYGVDAYHSVLDCVIERNLFKDIGNRTWLFRVSDPAIVAWGGDAIYVCPSDGGNHVRNNDFWNISYGLPRIDSGGNGARIRGGNCTYMNNTNYKIGQHSLVSEGGMTLRNNLVTSWSLTGDDTGPAGNNLVGVDLRTVCVDPDNGDFRLKAGSPAIGHGLDLTAYGFNNDYSGYVRS